MSIIANMVSVLTGTTGTGPITCGAAASAVFITDVQAAMVDQRPYGFHVQENADFMLVKGTYTAATRQLSIDTVLFSVIGGTFSNSAQMTLSGAAVVTMVSQAEDFQEFRGIRGITGTSDALVNDDGGGVVHYSNAAAIAVSIPQAGASKLFKRGWYVWLKNNGVSLLTLTPTTSTISGAATLQIPTKHGALLYSDGTNYWAFVMPLSAALIAANNLADVVNAATARTNLGINQAVSVASGTDLNTIVNAGSYYTVANTATNTPYASAYWYLTVETYAIANTFIKQTATRLDVAGNDTFIRTNVSGTWGAWAPVITGAPLAVALPTAAQGIALRNIGAAQFSLINGKIVESHASGVVTFSIKTFAGTDPSATDPVSVIFSDGTQASLTGALSVNSLNSSGTFGSVSGVPFRLWLCIFNDGGILRLGIRNCSDATGVYGFPGDGIGSTYSGNSTAGVTWNNSVTVTSKPFVIIGFADYDSGVTTAGTYAVSPTRIQLFGHHNKKPGDVVSEYSLTASPAFSTTSATPATTGLSKAITPTSLYSVFKVAAAIHINSPQQGVEGDATLNRSGTTIGNLGALYQNAGAIIRGTVPLSAIDRPATLSSVTYAVFAYASQIGTPVVFGGQPSTLTITEVMG